MESEDFLNAKRAAEKMMANCYYPYPHGFSSSVFYWNTKELAERITKEGKKAVRKMWNGISNIKKFYENWRKLGIVCTYAHGSEDSTDKDVHYVVKKLPEFAECKRFCDSIKNENANLIVIEDGVVTDCYKGTPDEINNALLATYNLHYQTYPLFVERLVKRDVYIKVIRAVRGILSHLSRSQYRTQVKAALKSNWKTRITTLFGIDLKEVDFDSLNNNLGGADIKKVIAFQIGQTMGLLNGVELYTKSAIAKEFPLLKPYLYRENVPVDDLAGMLSLFLASVAQIKYEDMPYENTNVVIFEEKHPYNLTDEKKIDLP